MVFFIQAQTRFKLNVKVHVRRTRGSNTVAIYLGIRQPARDFQMYGRRGAHSRVDYSS